MVVKSIGIRLIPCITLDKVPKFSETLFLLLQQDDNMFASILFHEMFSQINFTVYKNKPAVWGLENVKM